MEGGKLPRGLPKWMTLPSSLNMLTSSTAGMGCTFIFFRVAWSFLSSAPEDLWTFLTLRRGVPLPLLRLARGPDGGFLGWLSGWIRTLFRS